ncbi:MAG: hypothetical protein KF678_06660 [Phycisphaeraceae bacterium]|nr:hypothetical protein [Phycisphaeraceae bacterium]
MADAPGSAVKVCASCSKDVSKLPRTKDAKGRYLCQECLARLKQQPAAKPSAAKPAAKAAAAPAEADVLGKLLADTPGVELCPNCGGGMQVNSKICIRCGFNKETGKATKVQVELAPKEKGEKSAVGQGIAAAYIALADGPIGWLFAAGGALIGGIIGGGIYAYVMNSSGYEIFPIAVLVGFLAGGCGWLTVRWSASTSHGVIAAVIAVLCIFGGRYFAVSQHVEELVDQMTRNVRVEDEQIIAMVARDVHQDFSKQGKNYQWPEDSVPSEAFYQEEFPTPIWDEAVSRFEKMSEAAKAPKRQQAESELRAAIEEFKEHAADMAFTDSLNQTTTSRGVFRRRTSSAWVGYIRWAIAGLVVAFVVGSGFNNPFSD